MNVDDMTEDQRRAEAALSLEYNRRVGELMRRYNKRDLVGMVRKRWVGGGAFAPVERWTKEELAKSVVEAEESTERYEAYGRVALVNWMPADGTRPHCGGTGCTGHDSAAPWPETRERYRAKTPCVSVPQEGL